MVFVDTFPSSQKFTLGDGPFSAEDEAFFRFKWHQGFGQRIGKRDVANARLAFRGSDNRQVSAKTDGALNENQPVPPVNILPPKPQRFAPPHPRKEKQGQKQTVKVLQPPQVADNVPNGFRRKGVAFCLFVRHGKPLAFRRIANKIAVLYGGLKRAVKNHRHTVNRRMSQMGFAVVKALNVRRSDFIQPLALKIGNNVLANVNAVVDGGILFQLRNLEGFKPRHDVIGKQGRLGFLGRYRKETGLCQFCCRLFK